MAFADGRVGLDHLACKAGDLKMIVEGVVKCGRARIGKLNRRLAAEVEGVKNLFNQTEVILGDHSAGVAGLVFYGEPVMLKARCRVSLL